MFLRLVSSAPRGSLFVQAFIPEPTQKRKTCPPQNQPKNIHVAATDGGGLHVPASFARKTRAKDFGTDDKIFSQSLKAGQNIWTGGVGDRHKQGGFPRLNPLNQVKAFGLAFYDDWCYYRYTS